MTRVKYSTTLPKDLVHKTKALAKVEGLAGANEIIEKALEMYFQFQGIQIWEKEVDTDKYRVVTVGNGHTCLDYVNKRIVIDTVSDVNVLCDDGYYCILEI